MTLAEKTLVTIMRQRLAVPRPVLAGLFGVSTGTIATARTADKATAENRPATASSPPPPRSPPWPTSPHTDQAHGITLTPKTKPAR